MSTPARYHAIERVSPKGPGQKYIGTCWQCGETNLTLADATKPCGNISGLTETESLLMAITGPERGPDTETDDSKLTGTRCQMEIEHTDGSERFARPETRREGTEA